MASSLPTERAFNRSFFFFVHDLPSFVYQAPDVMAKLQKEGKLGKTVILELGTNGSFTEKQLMKTLDSLQGTAEIVLVNTRVPKPWETVVNETLSKVAESYPKTRLDRLVFGQQRPWRLFLF